LREYSRAEAVLFRRNRRWFVHVLALALWCAQLGSIAHASSHLNPDSHANPTQQLCGQCASFSPLQNMAGGALTAVLIVQFSHDSAHERVAAVSVPHRAFTAFRSRAPPLASD
jgi:hypothetical protein